MPIIFPVLTFAQVKKGQAQATSKASLGFIGTHCKRTAKNGWLKKAMILTIQILRFCRECDLNGGNKVLHAKLQKKTWKVKLVPVCPRLVERAICTKPLYVSEKTKDSSKISFIYTYNQSID